MEDTNIFYRDPALYDAVQAGTDSAETCRALLVRHRPEATTLVDFGCGTGRDLEVLSEYYECVGVDLQPVMVEYARRVRPRLDFRVGDMRTVRLRERVDAVVCLGNSLAYVHADDEIEDVFRTFAAHARGGALLVICSPVAPVIRPEPVSAVVDFPYGPASVTIRYEWDSLSQINTMYRRWILASGEVAEDEVRRRVLFPSELEQYVCGAGFEVVESVGDKGAELTGPIAYTVARFVG